MPTDHRPLSPDAQRLDDLIRDVHRVEQGEEPGAEQRDRQCDEQGDGQGDGTAAPAPSEVTDDRFEEYAIRAQGTRVEQAVERLAATAGGKIVIAAIMLLFVLLALAFVANFGTDDASTSADGDAPRLDQPDATPADPSGDSPPGAADAPTDAAPDAAGPGAPPTHEELAAQDPIPLTEGTWRFFADPSEETALYDFAFEPTGRFVEDGAAHNEGAYEVTGTTVEMALVRVATVRASDGTNERVEEIAWTELFTMTRTGNTMTGVWERESWRFGYDDGLVMRGMTDPATEIFARPQRPDDAG